MGHYQGTADRYTEEHNVPIVVKADGLAADKRRGHRAIRSRDNFVWPQSTTTPVSTPAMKQQVGNEITVTTNDAADLAITSGIENNHSTTS